ncbi:hypothetical protein MKZ38_000991 [Zalerion maritima]|uniref:Uncharacterized protein n=1 Tax=Zalerion maritima TaxID=339359 RepID=A0AAD5RYL8_9PEZI|nr:hypothetical protein MKZ38_000991 [Zalerion maritima]
MPDTASDEPKKSVLSAEAIAALLQDTGLTNNTQRRWIEHEVTVLRSGIRQKEVAKSFEDMADVAVKNPQGAVLATFHKSVLFMKGPAKLKAALTKSKTDPATGKTTHAYQIVIPHRFAMRTTKRMLQYIAHEVYTVGDDPQVYFIDGKLPEPADSDPPQTHLVDHIGAHMIASFASLVCKVASVDGSKCLLVLLIMTALDDENAMIAMSKQAVAGTDGDVKEPLVEALEPTLSSQISTAKSHANVLRVLSAALLTIDQQNLVGLEALKFLQKSLPGPKENGNKILTDKATSLIDGGDDILEMFGNPKISQDETIRALSKVEKQKDQIIHSLKDEIKKYEERIQHLKHVPSFNDSEHMAAKGEEIKQLKDTCARLEKCAAIESAEKVKELELENSRLVEDKKRLQAMISSAQVGPVMATSVARTSSPQISEGITAVSQGAGSARGPQVPRSPAEAMQIIQRLEAAKKKADDENKKLQMEVRKFQVQAAQELMKPARGDRRSGGRRKDGSKPGIAQDPASFLHYLTTREEVRCDECTAKCVIGHYPIHNHGRMLVLCPEHRFERP